MHCNTGCGLYLNELQVLSALQAIPQSTTLSILFFVSWTTNFKHREFYIKIKNEVWGQIFVYFHLCPIQTKVQ